MKKLWILAVLAAAALAGVAFYSGTFSGESASASGTASGSNVPAAGAQGAARRGGGAGGNFAAGRALLTGEGEKVTRQSVTDQVTVVGTLVGDATVSVSPRAAGRLQELTVRL